MADNEKRPLWAPWRIQYILEEREKDTGCFICGYAATHNYDIHNHVIYRGEHCFVFLNRYPYNSGHIMVSPFRHVAKLAELTPHERIETMDYLAKAELVFKEAMKPDGLNLGVNLGHVAGAAVEDHIHFHLVPRWSGDTNFMPVIGNIDCVPQALDDTAALLRDTWNAMD